MEKAYIAPTLLPPNRRRRKKSIANALNLTFSLALLWGSILAVGLTFHRISRTLDDRAKVVEARERLASESARSIGEQWGKVYATTARLIEWEAQLTLRDSLRTAEVSQ